jgi:hypothetical protein
MEMGDGGVGVGRAATDPKYDFLKQFVSENHADSDHFSNLLSDNDNSPYNDVGISTNYISNQNFASLADSKKNLSILSLNIQSLNSKFSEFSELISCMNNHSILPDIICLQEIWSPGDPAIFSLPFYHPLVFSTRLGNMRGGGLVFM